MIKHLLCYGDRYLKQRARSSLAVPDFIIRLGMIAWSVFVSLCVGFGIRQNGITIKAVSHNDVNNAGIKKGGMTAFFWKPRTQPLMLAFALWLFFRFIRLAKIINVSGIINLLPFIGSIPAAEAAFVRLPIAVQHAGIRS
jgi:hypothetical protein